MNIAVHTNESAV